MVQKLRSISQLSNIYMFKLMMSPSNRTVKLAITVAAPLTLATLHISPSQIWQPFSSLTSQVKLLVDAQARSVNFSSLL